MGYSFPFQFFLEQINLINIEVDLVIVVNSYWLSKVGVDRCCCYLFKQGSVEATGTMVVV